MKKTFREFHGKIMLFGEYSIMEGSPAAVIPYPEVNARLKFPLHEPDGEAIQSNHSLQSMTDYLHQNPEKSNSLDLRELESDLAAGLYMESNIPQNRGLGSSGAICAALFDAYTSENNKNLTHGELRSRMADLESYFHGTSSGVDPLCIYLNEHVIINKDKYYLPDDAWQTGKNKLRPFLVDTGKASQTKPLVQHFHDQMKHELFAGKFLQQYNPLVEQAVHQWKNGELEEKTLIALSEAQMEFLTAMIPEKELNIWNYGISSRLFTLKLCGSGGGGMILGFTEDPDATEICLREKFGIRIQLI